MKTVMMSLVGAGILCLGGMVAGCGESGNAASTVAADGRCPHEIKAESCPFCNPELVESEGFCGEHGFPEAICAKCKPAIKVAFRAKNDWCDEHKLPESQCVECNPELAENIRPGEHGAAVSASGAGSANCEHGIAEAKCPFCTPSLIDSAGFCEGHGVAEALCVECRPFMKTAFQAKGDWCAEHNTPESQCTICNP